MLSKRRQTGHKTCMSLYPRLEKKLFVQKLNRQNVQVVC